MLRYLEWAKANVWHPMMAEQRLRAEHMTFLLYGFVAETGLTPSQCMLVEERNDKGQLHWGYVKRDPSQQRAINVNQAELQKLSLLVKHLNNLVAEQRQEIAYLKGMAK